MTGADRIKNKIINDSKIATEAIMTAIEEESITVMDQAKSDIESKRKEMLDTAEKDAIEHVKRLVSVAKLEGRKQKLQVKQDMIEESFNQALERMGEMDADQYKKVIKHLIIKSINPKEDKGNIEIQVTANDKNKLGDKFLGEVATALKKNGFSGSLGYAKTERKGINGGFILIKGLIELNNTFKTILELKREVLEADVVNILFDGIGNS